jgi:chorismate mutase/prephenate dehydratase
MSDRLDRLRARIDDLDRRLLEILIRRAEAARTIGGLKARSGSTVLDPGREREVLDRLLERNAGRYPPEALTAIFREIISASRALEAPITVGYLGRPGGFAELATRRRFGAGASVSAYGDAAHLVRDLDAGRVEYALIAREVGDEDPALDTFDLFLDARVTLFGEFVLARGYAVLGRRKGDRPAVVYGHPSALARCREWVAARPEATVIAAAGSQEAVEAVTRRGEAALAPAHLADRRKLVILARSAEDDPDPRRRFFLLARSAPPRSGRDRTALVCVLPNRPGVLARFLAAFADHRANVAWIEIRESRHRPWEHAFLIEVDGHTADPGVKRALAAAGGIASHLQVLGSYPIDSAR